MLGWLFSTESETTRHSELVLVARGELSGVIEPLPDSVWNEIKNVEDEVSAGKQNPMRNLGFEQFGLDGNEIK